MNPLKRAGDAYQRDAIIPHCASCARPCCKLDDVVLDLDWKRAQALYQIKSSRRAFNRSLHDGSGPTTIQEHHGRYYAHGAPCPAYDGGGRCRVYGTDVKPPSCSDFPVYLDGDGLTADTRCEAVDVDALEAHLRAAFPAKRVRRAVDPSFPMFVTFDVE